MAIRFGFDAHLTRGHYRVDLNVRNPNRPGFLLQSDGVANFTIHEQITSRGLVDIGLKAMIYSAEAYDTAPILVEAG